MSDTNLASFKCKPRQLRRFVSDIIEAGLVPFVQSSPGIGKSSIMRLVADLWRLWLIDHRVSTSAPTDMTGLPRFDSKGMARFAPFADLFPLEDAVPPEDKDGWMLFFDEFNAAPRSVQAAAYKIVLDRMVGQFRLNERVAICLAGNLATDRAIVNPLSTAMQSRLVHLELQVDYREWLEDVAVPNRYDSRIVAFISQFESKLMDFKSDHNDRTFCCPRTWEFADRLLKSKDGTPKPITKANQEDWKILLSGTITSGVALEFVEFCQVYQSLISIAEILQDPENCRLPQELNLKWAVVTSMTENVTNGNFDKIATYADRFPTPFRILFYRMVLVRNKDIRQHPNFGGHVAAIVQHLHGTPNAGKL